MKLVLVSTLVSLLVAGARAEAKPDVPDKEFGAGHLVLLKNISSSLDDSVTSKRIQHQKIMETSGIQHEELKKERARLHQELQQDRAEQFEDVMKMGDKQHEEFKALLQQVMKNIESTDAYRLGQEHLQLIKDITKTLTNSREENKKHSKELQDLYVKQHTEIKNIKVQESTQIKQERTKQFNVLNQKRLQQDAEIKKLLQEVLSRIEEPRNCYELYQMGIRKNGVYLIKPKDMKENFFAFCDMDDGGWTVIQRRGEFGSPMVEFRQNWLAYRNGFGKLTEEFWLGNEYIYQLTKDKPFVLKVETKDYKNASAVNTFQSFQLSIEANHYRLNLGSAATGLTVGSFKINNGEYFSTRDRVDRCPLNGGWWYRTNCYASFNLNGYRQNVNGMNSITIDGTVPLSQSVMKIKPPV